MTKGSATTKKLDGKSLNTQKDLLDLLRKNFPEIFAEGKVDADKLRKSLGEELNVESERYGLNWAGKSDCFRHIQDTTTATLKPLRNESLDFDNTENIFIEGDNLEVLKILQRSYYGKIKMIYIDPPYNTGSDSFIYPDRFKQEKDEYEERAGIKDAEGLLTKDGFWRKNSKDAGHFHSNWLSMMYPRLFIAKNLLRPDGVIFVSIDDNEVHNLRMIMDEIFGEENFEGHIHWRRRHNQPNDPTKMIALVAEHIIAYSRNKEKYKEAGVGKVELTGEFSNPDNDSRGPWSSKPWKVGSDQSGTRYKIKTPTGKVYDEEWMGEKSTFEELLEDGRIIFPDSGNGPPRKKYFESERQEEGQCATNWWPHDRFGHNQEASNELTELFKIKNVFSNPKPVRLIENLISISNCGKDDIVLDFFAGSCTTAHSTMLLNTKDGLNVKFICVQMAEQLSPDDSEQKVAYEFCLKHKIPTNIAEIAKERIRRAAKKIKDETKGKLDFDGKKLDLGFKVFKLDQSNFKQWREDVKTDAELIEQLEIHTDNTIKGAKPDDMLFEIILKNSRFDLNAKISKETYDGVEYYRLSATEGTENTESKEGEDSTHEIICLAPKITKKLVDKILKDKPEKFTCLDLAFKDNDQLKTNTALQLEAAKIEFKVI